ncbi:MAG: MFS transporter [Clostridia bacterium]|nr:MFS transporter [Clostridia bacterium]
MRIFMKFKMTKLEKNWVLYDVGNSAFVMMICSLLPIYYDTLAKAQGYTEVQITAIFGTLLSLSALAIALLNPILGAIADNRGMKKKMFFIFLLIGVVGCFLVGISRSIPYLAAVIIMSRIGMSGSVVFYDAMLVDITQDNRMDNISSRGFAWGYIGSCIPFVMCLGIYVLATMPKGAPILPIGEGTSIIIGMAITGIWWFVMSTPLLRSYKQVHGVEPAKNQIKEAFKKLAITFKNLRAYKAAFMFVIAFFFYINGVGTIIGMSVVYAKQILGDINAVYLVVALLMTQVVAWPCALLFGKFADKHSPRVLILISIGGYIAITIFGAFLDNLLQFFIMAFFVGIFQGGIQALSRSYFAKLVPKEKSNEFFGIYDICGKGASVLGPALMGAATAITGSPRIGVSSLILFFLIGGIILLFLPKNVSDRPNNEVNAENLAAEAANNSVSSVEK